MSYSRPVAATRYKTYSFKLQKGDMHHENLDRSLKNVNRHTTENGKRSCFCNSGVEMLPRRAVPSTWPTPPVPPPTSFIWDQKYLSDWICRSYSSIYCMVYVYLWPFFCAICADGTEGGGDVGLIAAIVSVIEPARLIANRWSVQSYSSLLYWQHGVLKTSPRPDCCCLR